MDPLLGAAGAVTAVVAVTIAAAVAIRRRVRPGKPSSRVATPADKAMIAMLVALGYDPSKVLVQVVREGKDSSKTGLRVLGLDHEPIRYWRAVELKRKRKDQSFLAKYAKARGLQDIEALGGIEAIG